MSDSAALWADEQPIHAAPAGFLARYVFSLDHKVIAKQFLFFGLFWGVVGALMSMLIRWTLAAPGRPVPILGVFLFRHTGGAVPPDAYNTLFTLHGTIMIFFAVTPVLIGAFGNFLIPLQIGARDMLFPRLNLMSFWITFAAGAVMFGSLFAPLGGAAAGWSSYPTLSSAPWTPGAGQDLWIIAILLSGVGSTLGAVNYIATVIRLRAPGMGWFDLPLTIWGLFLTSILNALFLPVLAAGLILLLLDRVLGTTFFTSAAISAPGTQGDPVLYQHLFWIFGHPEVYIIILPAWGMVSDLLSFFARKPAFGARATAYSMTAITILSTLVYGHHMFTTGLSPLLSNAFMTLTLLISIPSGIFFLNWLGTLWQGAIRLTVPMWFAVGTVFTFGLGGLTGLPLAAISTDTLLHNSYYVVGHFHLTMAASALLGAFGAIYFWFPKMFGRLMSPRLGHWHFWLTFVPVSVLFVLMLVLGYQGMPRRVYNPYGYEFLRHTLTLNRVVSAAAFAAGLAQLLFFWNFARSLFWGAPAPANPWEVGTLEWTVPSPPPPHNFDEIPVVVNGPHEFSHPRVPGKDWLSQTEYIDGVSKQVIYE